jgi:hypothetical protein
MRQGPDHRNPETRAGLSDRPDDNSRNIVEQMRDTPEQEPMMITQAIRGQ